VFTTAYRGWKVQATIGTFVFDRVELPMTQNDGPKGIIAVDRKKLSGTSLGKTEKWPRTSRRQQRLGEVLSRRQPDLTVVLEQVDDLHNVSSVLRTCDAVGLLSVHLIYPPGEEPEGRMSRPISAGTAKWIQVVRHDSVDACYEALRAQGMTIIATALVPGAVDLYELDLAQPTALVFGNEMRGVTDEAVNQSDGQLVIPMLGMAQSLNVSVACAVVLYEAMRQRREAGAYSTPKLPECEQAGLLETWLKK
jgi:tRNA (guanosine-2'-O-)-methyltransferase